MLVYLTRVDSMIKRPQFPDLVDAMANNKWPIVLINFSSLAGIDYQRHSLLLS